MTPEQLLTSALYQALAQLSPDDGQHAARVTIRLADGQYVGDVLLSVRDLEALNIAIPSVGAYAQAERDDATLADLDASLAAVPELNPVALAQLQELDVTDLGDTDGGA
jgi:hypothetical protein